MAKFITEDKNPFKEIQLGILEAPSHIKTRWMQLSVHLRKVFNLSEHHFFFSFKNMLQNFYKAGQICEKNVDTKWYKLIIYI